MAEKRTPRRVLAPGYPGYPFATWTPPREATDAERLEKQRRNAEARKGERQTNEKARLEREKGSKV